MDHNAFYGSKVHLYEDIYRSRNDYKRELSHLFHEICSLIIRVPQSVLDYGCGQGNLADLFQQHFRCPITKYDPTISEYATLPQGHYDLGLCTDVLEHIPEEEIDGLLSTLSSYVDRAFFNIHLGEASTILSNGENAHCTIKPAQWWRRKIERHFGAAYLVSEKWPSASICTWEPPRLKEASPIIELPEDIHMLRSLLPVLNGPTLVLGSAPEPKLPSEIDTSWKLICVNGSGFVAKSLQLPVPDITIISGATFGKTQANQEGQLALTNLKTKILIYIDVSHSFDVAKQIMDKVGYRFEKVFIMKAEAREKIIRTVTRQPVDPTCLPSNGIFASILALFMGTTSVTLSGISLIKTGHHYSQSDCPRQHVLDDSRFISAMIGMDMPLITADIELAKSSGLPCHPLGSNALMWHGLRYARILRNLLNAGIDSTVLVYAEWETRQLVTYLNNNGVRAKGLFQSREIDVLVQQNFPSAWIVEGAPWTLYTLDDDIGALVFLNIWDDLDSDKLDQTLVNLYCLNPAVIYTEVDISRGREYWESIFLALNYRRHTALYNIIDYNSLDTEKTPIPILLSKIRIEAIKRYPLTKLVAERDLHMDMLRESGRRSDAHLIRYHLACQFVKPGDVILDAACGLGYGSAILATETQANRVIGVDVSPTAIEYANINFSDSHLSYAVQDVQNMDISDNMFDVVVSFETIEHIPNPKQLINEIARVLKPGGVIIASIPNDWGVNQHHLHNFNWQLLKELLAEKFYLAHGFGQNAGSKKTSNRFRCERVLTQFPLTMQRMQPVMEWSIITGYKK